MSVLRKHYLKGYTARQNCTASHVRYYSLLGKRHGWYGVIIADLAKTAYALRQRHERAILALKENHVEIDSRYRQSAKGVRSGINLPISFREQLIGVVTALPANGGGSCVCRAG